MKLLICILIIAIIIVASLIARDAVGTLLVSGSDRYDRCYNKMKHKPSQIDIRTKLCHADYRHNVDCDKCRFNIHL